MPNNNQANDRYNPPSNLSQDFEEIQFSEVEESDLFWLKEGGIDNPAYRKVNETEAGNTKTRVLESFTSKLVVYQRI